jgi:regulator of RNase E activity RraA
VRDVVEIRALGFPVFARGFSPRVGTNRTIGLTQVPTTCGGSLVNPGDYVLGDDDGVAIVPANLIDEIIELAEDRLAKEADFESRIRLGEHISKLVGLDAAILTDAEQKTLVRTLPKDALQSKKDSLK